MNVNMKLISHLRMNFQFLGDQEFFESLSKIRCIRLSNRISRIENRIFWLIHQIGDDQGTSTTVYASRVGSLSTCLKGLRGKRSISGNKKTSYRLGWSIFFWMRRTKGHSEGSMCLMSTLNREKWKDLINYSCDFIGQAYLEFNRVKYLSIVRWNWFWIYSEKQLEKNVYCCHC